ncbi:hypothetical protein OJ996_20595 [Luteolibacter sp. GHJ8]|uniref:Uncharacterized protein n=1 Tax=Luteolibacter rhizosphaerae TaxID=2989719 RepID=A0ABT3G8S5_9BACT|nr:hypothetical protein [Luteolibacter rhizosphaerae]MCW1915999.1 hypothetical protein [Luteolibacter rhizosphaerae]
MDAPTAVGTGLAVLGSRDVLLKLLGPTADYLGNEVKTFVQKCNVNLDNVFQKAVKKLGTDIEESGTVNSRVLKHVMDEGRFCEDDLTAEYYGGILASSRSSSGRDDRGVAIIALMKGLSVYQIRFHYIAYTICRDLFRGQIRNLADHAEVENLRFYVPTRVFSHAMGFTDAEDRGAILVHNLFGLHRHDLIDNFTSGDSGYLETKGRSIPEAGVIMQPTMQGAELYLWAMGLKGASGTELLTAELPSVLEAV